MNSFRQLLPAFAGPLLVVFGLMVLRSAPFVFVAYHLVLCLVVPWLMSRVAGRPIAAHLAGLGLNRRGVQSGVVLALAFAVVPPLAYQVQPGMFPDTAQLQAALADWGLARSAPGWFLFFMAVVNGPAEELFWRGWLLNDGGRGRATGRGTRLLLAILFTSYHAATVGHLAPTITAAALMLLGVFAAAAFWTWARFRWQSVWPPLLAHTGATCGYLYVCARLLDAG